MFLLRVSEFFLFVMTGIESFSKLGDSIYFLEEGKIPGLYIIQYIPSTFDWKAAGLTIKQQAKPLFSTDSHFEVSLSISAKVTSELAPSAMVCRSPCWIQESGCCFFFSFAFSYMQGHTQPAKVSVRIPSWTSTDGATATLNGQKLNLTSAGSFTDDILILIDMRLRVIPGLCFLFSLQVISSR